jgi:hypothetical protein
MSKYLSISQSGKIFDFQQGMRGGGWFPNPNIKLVKLFKN